MLQRYGSNMQSGNFINLLVTGNEQFTNLNPLETVTTDANSNLTTIPYTEGPTGSTIVQRDPNGSIIVNGVTGITGSFQHLYIENLGFSGATGTNLNVKNLVFDGATGSTGTFGSLVFNGATGTTLNANTINANNSTVNNFVFTGATGNTISANTGTFNNLVFSGATGGNINANTITGNTIVGATGTFNNLIFTGATGGNISGNIITGNTGTFNSLSLNTVSGTTGSFTNLTFGGATGGTLALTSFQSSSNSSTGALTVSGGVGIGQDLNVGSSLSVTLDAGITRNLIVGGTGTFGNRIFSGFTQDSSSTSTGAITTLGGLGVAKNIFGNTGSFVQLNASGVSGTTGTFRSVIGSTGNYDQINTQGMSGTTGAFNTIIFNNPTTSYTAGPLNYYEEYSATIQFVMSGNNISQTTDLKIIRIGKAVILSLTNNINFTTTGASSGLVASGVIPTRFRPPSTMLIDNATRTTVAGVVTVGLTRVTDLGDIFVYTDFALAGFGAASNIITPTSISYCLH